MLKDARGDGNNRADICRMLLDILAERLTLTCGSGPLVSDPVLFHFHRLGVHGHLLRYTASVTPEGDAEDALALKQVGNWACVLAYVFTVFDIPQGDTLRDSLHHFLSDNCNTVEQLVRVGVGMRQLVTENAAQWLEVNGDELQEERWWYADIYAAYMAIPARLERLSVCLVSCMIATGGDLERVVRESPLLQGISGAGVSEVDRLLGDLAHERQYWEEVEPLSDLHAMLNEDSDESSGSEESLGDDESSGWYEEEGE
ncbi:hypothetical protein KIPB_011765 [Kipferlia bialata]|uniref:Uncharacterized protein n=1 Tax=Kipferlia bialata TaxID=797122 RepID=A0A391NQQ8_9EUKA|nr:hypothetical protein KIPB_011765 [Kipferlia bialata]|eukprot:g11765.t1